MSLCDSWASCFYIVNIWIYSAVNWNFCANLARRYRRKQKWVFFYWNTVYIYLPWTHRRPKLSGSALLFGTVILQVIFLYYLVPPYSWPIMFMTLKSSSIRTSRWKRTSAMFLVSVSSTFASYASSNTPSLMILLILLRVLIHSRHDYCYRLFAGLSASQLTRLQSVLTSQGGCQACSSTSWAGLSKRCHQGLAALVLLSTASDLQVVPTGEQVSPQSDTRLSGSVLCVTVWRCCSFSVAFCWQFPALDTVHEHCQLRLTGFLLLWSRFLQHSSQSISICHLCLWTASKNILRLFLPRCISCTAVLGKEQNVFIHLSIRPSVCQMHELWWQNKRNFCRNSYTYKRSIHLVLQHEERLVETTTCIWNFGPNWPCSFKNMDFQSIFTRSTSAVTPSKKSSIITNRTSSGCFPMRLRWTAYVAPKPPYGGSKREKIAIFRLKVHFSQRKSATKFQSAKKLYGIQRPIYLRKNGWWGACPST